MNRVQMIHFCYRPSSVSVTIVHRNLWKKTKHIFLLIDYSFSTRPFFPFPFFPPFLPVLLSTLFPPSEVRVTRSCHEALMEHESTGYRKNNPSKIPRRGTPYTKIARATGHCSTHTLVYPFDVRAPIMVAIAHISERIFFPFSFTFRRSFSRLVPL